MQTVNYDSCEGVLLITQKYMHFLLLCSTLQRIPMEKLPHTTQNFRKFNKLLGNKMQLPTRLRTPLAILDELHTCENSGDQPDDFL